jgi:hypothetical protein
MYGSRIYIRTRGYGQGSYGFFNNLLKHSVWDSVDQKVIDKKIYFFVSINTAFYQI